MKGILKVGPAIGPFRIMYIARRASARAGQLQGLW